MAEATAQIVRDTYARIVLEAGRAAPSGSIWPRLLVNLGGCGTAAGGEAVAAAIRAEVRRLGLGARVVAAGCAGDCWAAPSALVQRPDGTEIQSAGLTPDQVPAWVESAVAGGPDQGNGLPAGVPLRDQAFFQPQETRLLARSGRVDPVSVEEALSDGLYRGFAKALAELTPESVIAEVERSGLRGRGGAFFPVHIKWQGCRAAGRGPRYLVVNAEEGEPGIYKDRHLMEGDPHRMIEGILIAAYAIGADRAFVYINGEAPISFRRLGAAIERARSVGLVGERILGSDFSLQIELRRGAGGYVLGEETTMLNSIEGRRSEPRLRPPFPVESGVYGAPTVINNAETIANLPGIIDRGADWFRSVGPDGASGTKLVNLAGNVRRPGLAEVAFGTPVRVIVDEIGGGLRSGQLTGLHIGGPSGSLVGPAAIETPYDPPSLQQSGGLLGAGGVVPFAESTCPVDLARYLTRYNREESCGKCTPCREGTPRLWDLLGEITSGQATPATLERIEGLSDVVTTASLCGLGQMAPNPIRTLLQNFPDEVRRHVVDRRCSAGVCRFAAAAGPARE